MKHIYIVRTLNNEIFKAKIERETKKTYFYTHKSFNGMGAVNKTGTDSFKVFHEFDDAKMYLIGFSLGDLMNAEASVKRAEDTLNEIKRLKESDT